PGTEVQLAANATATAVPGQDRMPFRDVFGSQFYAEVSVGEPALVMRMLLDTGSPTTTLFSQHCGDESCRTHRLYKSEDSATFERDGRPIRIPYATGMVSGIVSRDDFRIGKFTVANMTFTEITAAPGRTFMYTSFDGVLGLGRPGKNEIVYDGMPPFMDRLWASGQLAERMFSLYFSPTRNYHNWLTIGGQDAESMAKLVQPLTWAPLISDAYWQVAAIGMTLNTGTLDIRQVVFDTGTSMIGVSKKVRDQIVHSVWHFTMNDIAVISCKSTLNLTITIADGSTISLRDDELMLPVGAIGRCMLSIVALPIDDDTIVLGTPFFQRYYVSFDEGNQRIGFGRTRQ
ncbi:acid protease, partial [Caulochytrium protostelioides]